MRRFSWLDTLHAVAGRLARRLWLCVLASASTGALAQTIPPAYVGQIIYKGSYEGTVADEVTGRGKARKLKGNITFVLSFNRGKIEGSYTGSLNKAVLTGVYENGQCKLVTGSDPVEGACDFSRFAGSMQSANSSKRTFRLAFDTAFQQAPTVDGVPAIPMEALQGIMGHWVGSAECKRGGASYAAVTIGMPRWIGFADEWAKREGRQTRAELFPNRREIGLLLLAGQNDFLVQRARWEQMVDGVETPWNDARIEVTTQKGREPAVQRLRIERTNGTVQLTAFQEGCEPVQLSRAAAPMNPGDPVPGAREPGVYKPSDFAALKPWAETFDKAIKDPKGYSTFLSGLGETSTGSGALFFGLLRGPGRNAYQLFLTDLETYLIHTPRIQTLADRTQQCLAPRNYSAAEACDCLAGFPGDTTIGPGAGELVVRQSANLVVRSCSEALQSASPRDRPRYLAQRARAQLLQPNQAPAGEAAREAMAAGYPRAQEIFVYAQLRELEFLFEGMPGPTQAQVTDVITLGKDAISRARSLKLKGTHVMARQYQQVLDRVQMNQNFFGELQKMIDAPPPLSPDQCEIGYMTENRDGSPKPVFDCGPRGDRRRR